MKELANIGTFDPAIQYIDRPTVKAIVTREDKILILNDGLLPGGGIDASESDHAALHRELQEELGMTVKNISELGSVKQFRNFLRKRYIVKGYVASFADDNAMTNPQDAGEAKFIKRWVSVTEAIELVENSIVKIQRLPMNDDSVQGKLYNLMTTRALLSELNKTK